MKAKKPAKKKPAKKRTRTFSAVTGYGAKKTANPRETVTARAPVVIWRGWAETDDDGVPNGDPGTGELTLYFTRALAEARGWNAQYVRLVPAREPRGRG